MFKGKDIYDLVLNTGGDPVQVEKIMKILQSGELDPIRKDVVGIRPLMDHRLYENGPFGVYEDEVTSLVIDGGSPILSWFPTRKIEARKSRVSHLEWMAPDGYTGAISYPEWLATIEIGECGYGPAGTGFNGFTYEQDYGSFSFKTTTMKPYEDGGLRYYKEQPQMTFRGGPALIGGTIDNDADWAMARLLWTLQSHVGYNVNFGDRQNSDMEWNGLDLINRPGYVQSRIVGQGNASWADPIWINAAGVNNIQRVMQTLRVLVRTLRKRAADRNWSINQGDMILYMGRTMWDNIREAVAQGVMYQFASTYGFDGQISYRDYKDEYRATATNGSDMAALEIDGIPIPVLLDGNIERGATMTVDDGAGGTEELPVVVGDIHVLTRRANGMTFWWQEYLDWGSLDYPNWDEERFMLQGGQVRAGYVSEASKCYYYFGEMYGGLVCTMLPMQGRISSVVVPVMHEMELEQAAFWARNFYGFGGRGAAGGSGEALLNPTP